MKRGLTALLTFALVGSLMFMGFAGTAAAQDDGLVDIGSDVSVDQDATSGVEVTNNQENTNEQLQVAASYSSSDKSKATTYAEQSQTVEQGNANTVSDVSSVSTNTADTDASTGIDVNFDLDFDFPGDGMDDDGDDTNGDDNGGDTDT